VVLSLKIWEQIFEMTTMASKEEINGFHENFKEFHALLD